MGEVARKRIRNDLQHAMISGTHTVTAAEATATAATIATGIDGIEALMVQVRSSAGVMKSADETVTESAGTVTVANGTSTVLAENDVIHWIALP